MRALIWMRCILLSVTVLTAYSLRAGGFDWAAASDPGIHSINRAPSRTYSLPAERMSLNGEWRYSWCGETAQMPRDFWRTDFDDSDWSAIDVPCCVELRGWGVPHYTSLEFPHKADPPVIRDYVSGLTNYNPVSSYRRTFTVPDSWRGKRIVLRFDGVDSCAAVWLNGRFVGYSEDSKLPAEFDVTRFLSDDGSPELLCVQVWRWCDGSYLEDMDFWRFSGIFRDVALFAVPPGGLEDFRVSTIPLDGSFDRWKLSVEIDGGSPRSAALYDAQNTKVGDLVESGATATKVNCK